MTRGGYRKGSGRPTGTGKWGESTKPVRVPESKVEAVKAFVNGDIESPTLPLFANTVQAGSPAMADEHVNDHINLHDHLVQSPEATFFARAQGDSMIEVGIFDGDMLVVDSSVEARNGQIVIAGIDGALTVKRLNRTPEGIELLPENKDYKPIPVSPESDFRLWGVVTSVIHKIQ